MCISLKYLIRIHTAVNPLLPGVLLVTSKCLTSDLIKVFLTVFKGMASHILAGCTRCKGNRGRYCSISLHRYCLYSHFLRGCCLVSHCQTASSPTSCRYVKIEGRKQSGYVRPAAAVFNVAAALSSVLSIIFLGPSTVFSFFLGC